MRMAVQRIYNKLRKRLLASTKPVLHILKEIDRPNTVIFFVDAHILGTNSATTILPVSFLNCMETYRHPNSPFKLDLRTS